MTSRERLLCALNKEKPDRLLALFLKGPLAWPKPQRRHVACREL